MPVEKPTEQEQPAPLTIFGTLISAMDGPPTCCRTEPTECTALAAYVGVLLYGPLAEPTLALCQPHALEDQEDLHNYRILLVAIRQGVPILAPEAQAAIDEHAEADHRAARNN